MSDLFHEAVPLSYIQRVFRVMTETPHHTYQVLTKRSERLSDLSEQIDWPENVWMGVSIESDAYWWRIEHLKQCSARTKFISLEPLLGPIASLDFNGIDWVIAGGESGPGARPVNADWIRDIRDACLAQHVSFHFKQWGGTNKKAAGRILDGRTWDGIPPGRRDVSPSPTQSMAKAE